MNGTAKAQDRRRAHAANRRKMRLVGDEQRKAWRNAPATPEQLRALRRIAVTTGRTFAVNVSQGEAWRRVKSTRETLSESQRVACAPPWYSPRRDQDETA